MKEFKNVQSTAEMIQEIEVNKTTTYVRTNIHQEQILVMPEERELISQPEYDAEGNLITEAIYGEIIQEAEYMTVWVYDEKQYENKEYIEQLTNVVNVASKIIDYFATIIPIPVETNE